MAPAAEQQTALPPMAMAMAHDVAFEADNDALAGRQFELPMRAEEQYYKQVDESMPLTLQNVMGREEYSEQVAEINRLLKETAHPYVQFIQVFRTVYIVTVIVLLFLMVGAIIGSFFTMGMTIILLFIVWIPAVIAMVIGTFYARYAIVEKKKTGDERSRQGLVAINEKWLSRGIAWRQKEGEAVFANITAGRRRMAWISLRPLNIVMELAPNAANLFRAQGPFPSSSFERAIDMEGTENGGLFGENQGQEMQFVGAVTPQAYSTPQEQYSQPQLYSEAQAFAEPQPFKQQPQPQEYSMSQPSQEPMPYTQAMGPNGGYNGNSL